MVEQIDKNFYLRYYVGH